MPQTPEEARSLSLALCEQLKACSPAPLTGNSPPPKVRPGHCRSPGFQNLATGRTPLAAFSAQLTDRVESCRHSRTLPGTWGWAARGAPAARPGREQPDLGAPGGLSGRHGLPHRGPRPQRQALARMKSCILSQHRPIFVSRAWRLFALVRRQLQPASAVPGPALPRPGAGPLHEPLRSRRSRPGSGCRAALRSSATPADRRAGAGCL